MLPEGEESGGVSRERHQVKGQDPPMTGLETILAALVGLGVGAGIAAEVSRRRERRWSRERLELDTRVRRSIVPVLERRADTLGIPPAQRGSNDDGALDLALTLADVIRAQEESVELPFGDTVEVARKELDRELAGRRAGGER